MEFILTLPLSPPTPRRLPPFLSLFLSSYLSLVWRTPADVSSSLEVSAVRAAIFSHLITVQSSAQGASKP